MLSISPRHFRSPRAKGKNAFLKIDSPPKGDASPQAQRGNDLLAETSESALCISMDSSDSSTRGDHAAKILLQLTTDDTTIGTGTLSSGNTSGSTVTGYTIPSGYTSGYKSAYSAKGNVSDATATQPESVVRRRSPKSPTDKTPSGWWGKSPKNVFPFSPRFQKFENGQESLGGISEESGRLSDESSVNATIGPQAIDDSSGESSGQRPSVLHTLCFSATDPDELWKAVSLVTPSSASKMDSLGRLPLHCLSYNSVLIEKIAFGSGIDLDRIVSPIEDRLVDYVTQMLLQAYPASMITADMHGFIPFQGAISEWVDQTIAADQNEPAQARDRFASLWTKSIKRIGQKLNSARSLTRSSAHDKTPLTSPQHDIESAITTTESPKHREKSQRSNLRLTAASYFAIQMLSAILNFFEERHDVADQVPWKAAAGSDRAQDSGVHDVSSEIVRSIASIPKLLHVVLLLDDAEQRNYVLSTTVMKKVIISKHAVGEWLTEMLRSPTDSKRAIDYLRIVSLLTCDKEDRPNARFYQEAAYDEGYQENDTRDEVAEEISHMEGFVPSLLSLSARQVEEAATTKVVQRVLDKIMSRPFCVTIVFCDAVFLTILIAGFRLAVNHLIIGSTPEQVLKYVYLANVGLFYFVERELGRAVGLLAVTQQARVYFFSFWNVTDVLSTILALVSTVVIRKGLNHSEEETDMSGIRNLLAVTTGFLWLRVLNFLKGINMQLATFVFAILQITKDVLWFCMIVLILVIAFSQMFFTVLATDCSKEGDGADYSEDTCKQSEYFLQTYLLLIFQEFDREKFTTAFSVLLAVVYSFMVVLVMLNVLIAVASDSHEKCLVRSESLFGRARVMMIAELVCFQNLLRRNADERSSGSAQLYKAWWSADWRVSGWSRASVLFFALAFSVLAAWIAGELVGVTTGRDYGALTMSLVSIMATVCLFFGILSFLHFCSGDEGGNKTARPGWFRKAMLRVLGRSGDSTCVSEWKGRLLYLKEEMARVSDGVKQHADERAKAIELSMQEDLAQVKKSVDNIREDMKPNNEALHSSLAQVFGALKELERKVG